MVCTLSHGTNEIIAGIVTVHSFYSEEFSTNKMSFGFAKAAWLQCLDMKMDYFAFSPLDAQDAWLERCLCSPESVVVGVQSSSAAVLCASQPEGDLDDWCLNVFCRFEYR